MTDYQGNSHKAKEGGKPAEPKKIERITTSEVKIRKRGPLRTFKNLIIEADMGSVGRFVWLDILVPMMKNMFVASIEQGANRMVYGDRRAGFRLPPSSGMLGLGSSPQRGLTTYTPYSSMSQPQLPAHMQDPRTMQQLPAVRTTGDSRSYLIRSKDEAEETLTTMAMVIDQYHVVSVADLHEMLGVEVSPIDHRWGWVDVRAAQIRQVRDGWALEVPQPEALSN